MAPFIVFLVSFVLFRSIGFLGWTFFDSGEISLRFALACMFLLTASAHWGKRRSDLIHMVPQAFPRPDWIVSVTGWLEIAGALGLLIPLFAPYASTGLILLLLAMFPANIRAARQKLTLSGKPATPLFLRTILQIFFLIAVWLAG